MPPNGFFLMVADIVAATGQTRITVYGRNVGKDADLADALPAWANGVAAACPLESSAQKGTKMDEGRRLSVESRNDEAQHDS
jgi:hypothetical protein